MTFIITVIVLVFFATSITILLFKNRTKQEKEGNLNTNQNNQADFNSRTASLQDEIGRLHNQLKGTENRYSDTVIKFQQSQIQVQELLEKMYASEHMREHFEQRMHELKTDETNFEKIKIANDTLEKEKISFQEKTVKLEEQIRNLDDTIQKEKLAEQELKQQFAEIEAELQKATEQEEKYKHLQDNNTQQTGKVKELEDKVSELTELNNQQQQLLSQLKDKNQQLLKQLQTQTIQPSDDKDTSKHQDQTVSLVQDRQETITFNDNPQEDIQPESSSDISSESLKTKKKKIGEILIRNNMISNDILKEALEYQKNFGVGVAQCLVSFGYISEQDLAQSISYQFSTPYMPLSASPINDEIIKLVPHEIANKYCLIPIDKTEQTIIIVMANPMDTEAIDAVARATGHKVMAFVGILSDLTTAIRHYYKSEQDSLAVDENAPQKVLIQTRLYVGVERRNSIRLNASIPMYYVLDEQIFETKTRDISTGGFSFESHQQCTLGVNLIVKLNLPDDFCAQPTIEAEVVVVRINKINEELFLIGTKFTKIDSDPLACLMKYARSLII